MAYFHVWVKPEAVDLVRLTLQHFVHKSENFFEIESEALGGKMALLAYKRVPGRSFMERAKVPGIISVQRLGRYFEKKS